MIGLEESEESEYIFLIPLENFGEIDPFFKQQLDYQFSLSMLGWMIETQTLNSLINFKILTIHQYKRECSYCASFPNMLLKPRVSYEILNLNPGTEELFEQGLLQKVSEALKLNPQECWRVWKTMIGVEFPKYIIVHFMTAQEEVQAQLVDSSLNKIIRRKHSGKAVVKPELSISGS